MDWFWVLIFSFEEAASARMAASSVLETLEGGAAMVSDGARHRATRAAVFLGFECIDVDRSGDEIQVVAGPMRKPWPF